MVAHRFLTKRHANYLSKVANQILTIVNYYFPGASALEVVCTQEVKRRYETVEIFGSVYKQVTRVGVHSQVAVTICVTNRQYPLGSIQTPEECTEKMLPLVRILFDVVQRRFFIIPTKLAIYRIEEQTVVLIREPEELVLSS